MYAKIERCPEFIERMITLANFRADFNLVVSPYESPVEQYKDMFFGWGDKPKVTITAKEYKGSQNHLKAELLGVHIFRAREIPRFYLKGCVGAQHPQAMISDINRSFFNQIAWQPVVLEENSFVVLLELKGIPVGQPA